MGKMIQKLQKRTVAIILAVLVVAVSTLLGGWSTLSTLRDEASESYYDAGGSGRGIYHDLSVIIDESYNLLTVAGRYLDANDPRIDAVQQALQGLASPSPSDGHSAAEQLRMALGELNAELQKKHLSDADKAFQEKINADISASYRRIAQSDYNRMAALFNEKLDTFPASLLGGIVGIKPLDLYE